MTLEPWQPFTVAQLEGERSSTFLPLTPGLILSVLSDGRQAEVSAHLGITPLIDEAPTSTRGACTDLLGLLFVDELRAVAREMGLPTDGKFIDLYRRLRLSMLL
jgi:hypothetical protein